MLALTTEPVLIAVVAVGGTIAGAAIAGVIQLFVARLTTRSQVEALRIQAKHEADRTVRDERRKVYGEFVYKTVAAEEMLQSYCAQAGIDDLVDPISGVDVSKAVEECALMYATVSLLAGAKVRRLLM